MRISNHSNNYGNVAFSLAHGVTGFCLPTGQPGDTVLLTKQEGSQTLAFAIGILDYRTNAFCYPSAKQYDVWKLRDFVAFNRPFPIDQPMKHFLGGRKFGLAKLNPRIQLTNPGLLQLINLLASFDQRKVRI